MKQKIKDEISTFLENVDDFTYKFIKNGIEKVLSNFDIKSFVICGQENNFNPIENIDKINADVYIRETILPEYTLLCFYIKTDKLYLLRKERKKKLNKIYEL